MHAIRLIVENVKRLKYVDLRLPADGLLKITGKNGSGKTSLLDAIRWCLAGTATVQPMPIRRGCEKALIRLDCGDVVVTRKFSSAGSTVTIESADGARYPSPQKMLDALCSKIAFDPIEFSRMDRKQQYDALKQILKIEVDLDALDRENQRDYEARKELNRIAREKAAQAKAFTFRFDQMDEPIDLGQLGADMQAASRRNQQHATEVVKRNRIRNRITNLKSEVEALERQLEQKNGELLSNLGIEKEWEALGEDEDLTPYSNAIRDGEARNVEHRERERQDAILKESAIADAQAKTMTAKIESREAQKAEALAAAEMPIQGISLGDGEVLLDGVPWEQAGAAEQIRTSTAIAMAGNPKLKLALVRDGGLILDEGLKIIEEMARAAGFLVLVEIADGSGKVGVVLEDGAVKEPSTELQEIKA